MRSEESIRVGYATANEDEPTCNTTNRSKHADQRLAVEASTDD
ncbi:MULTISPECIES: hypothetical protein [Halobacterium]|nr:MULTISPECIES: hypothetical protein [Halobacterium]